MTRVAVTVLGGGGGGGGGEDPQHYLGRVDAVYRRSSGGVSTVEVRLVGNWGQVLDTGTPYLLHIGGKVCSLSRACFH